MRVRGKKRAFGGGKVKWWSTPNHEPWDVGGLVERGSGGAICRVSLTEGSMVEIQGARQNLKRQKQM